MKKSTTVGFEPTRGRGSESRLGCLWFRRSNMQCCARGSFFVRDAEPNQNNIANKFRVLVGKVLILALFNFAPTAFW